jgi:transposase InsO family protein
VANAKKIPHPVSKRPSALQPLERLHADIVESPVPNASGKRYWASVTDEFSRWTWVLFLKNKSDFKEAFLGLLLPLEGTPNRRVQALHTDRGGESMSNDLRKILHTCGIATSATSAGSPESNGIAERTQGFIKIMMHPVLLASGLKPALWSECAAAATYVRNRLPHRLLHDKRPYDVLYGVLPDLSKLRIWVSMGGAKPYPLLSALLKGKAVAMVGYGDTSNWAPQDGYRVWDGNKVFVTRNVQFDEVPLLSGYARRNTVGGFSVT